MFRALALVFCCVATGAIADPITIDTYAGPTTIEGTPDKIAVFDIAALDTLDALGVSVDGVVNPQFVPYVSDTAEGAQNVGSLFEPDFEAVAALAPDLIIAGGRSSKQVPALAGLAPTLDMTIWEDIIGQGLARLDAYGAIFGKQAEAAALRNAFEIKLASARDSLSDKGSALIVMTNGPKISAYGSGGRFGWIHSALGLDEAVKDVEKSTHGEAISFEFIKQADPDILIVIDRLAAIGRDGESAAATLDNPLVHATKAWKTGKVIYLDSASIYVAGGGIQALNLALDQILAAFADG